MRRDNAGNLPKIDPLIFNCLQEVSDCVNHKNWVVNMKIKDLTWALPRLIADMTSAAKPGGVSNMKSGARALTLREEEIAAPISSPELAPPTVGTDYTFTDQDESVTFHVLANDTDPDGDSLTVGLLQNPINGSAFINPNQTITYTPDPGYFGTEVMFYGARDSTGSTSYGNIFVTVHEVTTPPPLPGDLFLSYDFDYGAESMSFAGATFRSGTDLAHASSSLAGGHLSITLGGGDNSVVDDMSGAWSGEIFLSSAKNVIVAFDYNITMAGSFETNEKFEVLLAVDYALRGVNGADYIVRLNGPDDVEDLNTGWVSVELDLGDLGVGQHVFDFGAYLNRKNQSDEVATLLIDNLAIYTNDPADPSTTAEPTPHATTVRLTTAADVFKMRATDEQIDAGFGDDDVNGMGGDDLIFGSDGNDVLKGAKGADELVGGSGRDTLFGNSGADTIWGGAGLDTMIGDSAAGGYADRFCFTEDDLDAVDRIRDFSVTDGDILDLSNLITGFTDGVSDVTEFVKFTDIGTKTVVKIDRDGGGDSFHKLLFLNGVTGYEDEAFLYGNGNIDL